MKLNEHFVTYSSGKDGARFISNTTFDKDLKVIEEVRDHYLLQSTLESASVLSRHKAWIEGNNLARPGNDLYLGAFAAFEEDPVVKELGGFRYFLGKTPEDLDAIKVDLKTLAVVK